MKKLFKIITNDNVTVVIDPYGNKAVCRVTEGDTYDRTKGILLAITKLIAGPKVFRELCNDFIEDVNIPFLRTCFDRDVVTFMLCPYKLRQFNIPIGVKYQDGKTTVYYTNHITITTQNVSKDNITNFLFNFLTSMFGEKTVRNFIKG